MKHIYIFGNWKSNKTVDESVEWMRTLAVLFSKSGISTDLNCVVCSPYTTLYILQKTAVELSVKVAVGAQDISPYPDGAYTGQVSARMIKDLVEWVIIGHSERRKYFHETDEDLAQKVQKAKTVGLKVVYCVSSADMPVPPGVDIAAYEPLWAIGTGKTDTPQNANEVLKVIKERTKTPIVLYGGSVTEENVDTFVSQSDIDGVLVGGASLDPEKFYNLVIRAASINN